MKVYFSGAFQKDVLNQQRWLRRHEGVEYIKLLKQGILEAADLVSHFPYAGRLINDPLHQIVLRMLPFVIWYGVDTDKIIFLRLFHVRQDRNI